MLQPGMSYREEDMPPKGGELISSPCPGELINLSRTRWRDYIYQPACEKLDVSLDKLEEVAREMSGLSCCHAARLQISGRK